MEDRLEYPDLDDSATLAEIDAEIERLERELTDSRCAHETRLLTKRTFANGSVHFVLQCRRCGEQQGGPARAKEAQAQLNGAEALPFDVDLQSTYGDWRGDMVQRLTELNCSRHALIDPEAAASSALVDEERDQQKARVAGIVASCRDELRAELGDDESVAGSLANAAIGLRRTLRDARIAAASRFTSEDELKLWLEAHLADDFDLVREVVGSHLAERTRVQIDYIAYPRPHLVAAGFAQMHFGLEVKFLDPCNGFSSRAARALWQTVSYTDSEFDLAGRPVRLKYALLFSNLSFEQERSLLENLGSTRENDLAPRNRLPC